MIPHAFEAAIDNFNFPEGNSDLDELAKTWPLYLNNKTSGMSEYWHSMK
jgi:hypothetical protein